MQHWVEKYRPKTVSDLVFNKDQALKVLKFVKEFTPKSEKKAIILVGPPGTGKTTSVYVAVNTLNYDILELNASDSRKKDDVERIIGRGNNNVTLGMYISNKKKKVIFIDEADGVSGREERGGLSEIIKIMKDTKYPIIFSYNYENQKMDTLTQYVKEKIVFGKPKKEEIVAMLKKILDNEKIPYNESVLRRIAHKSNGDIRAAINDAQFISSEYKSLTDPSLIDTESKRNEMISEEDALLEILNSETIEDALYFTQTFSSSYDKILRTLGDTILSQRDLSLPETERIVTADGMLTHILKNSDYKLLGYFFKYIASLGPSRSDGREIEEISPQVWRKGRSKSSESLKKIQKVIPINADKLYNNVIPMLYLRFSKDKKAYSNFLRKTNLTEEEWREILSR